MTKLSTRPKTEDVLEFSSEKKSEEKTGIKKRKSRSRVISLTKILICSSDEAVSARWNDAIDGQGRASTAADKSSLIAALEQGGLDVVLVDLLLFDDYRKIPDELFNRYPNTSFILFSVKPNEEEGIFLISKGGKGYCNRYITEQLLNKAIEVVRMGEVWLGRNLLFKLMENLARLNGAEHAVSDEKPRNNSKLSQLTGREHEIALLVGEGASNKVIARKLDITERTVKAHVGSIFKKTGTKDRLQLGLLINIKHH